MNKKQAQCAWQQEQPMKALWVYTPYDYHKYWFYPRPALMGKWIHVLGDSLDEGYLFDILTYALKQQYSETPVTADVTLPGWDWSDQHPLRIFHFKKLRFTMTFQKLTRPRIDGFHFYEDPQEYAGREWPGSAGIHNMWQEARIVLPVGHQPRPTLAVFHFALHSLSRGRHNTWILTQYRLFLLYQLVYWWKSNQEYGDVPLVWRGSSVTHFHDREDYLYQKHRCLTRYRLLERDRIAKVRANRFAKVRANRFAKTVMRETNTPVLDMWSVTDGRPSASWDRRHFSDRGDCYGTKVERSMVSVLLSHLCIMSSRKIGGMS
ncbi:hypothetical protein SARC_01455 [Sphaeroforma arctica JP610]|uniref:Uncharacterized protein n=1 Tax=Sphaeroforma arctica JP610 TaxID=667725 RepID=A0A0L0GBM7_9EUKA|nr:hypothetical protein SARC_01455 [Sphaeroforma arctica JP610]KNC86405.1 hypothetical protein SARC_01455 [Sphaeroforma arctica JP610]|eukprot:XP_014160307.1 hypothetical protein SARC_01455 [Sphaeroforma arctica JP610]